jgi:hypothetical protein
MVKKRFAPDTHINGQGEIEELLYYNGCCTHTHTHHRTH